MPHSQVRTHDPAADPRSGDPDAVVIDLRQPPAVPPSSDDDDPEIQRLVDAAWVVLARSGWSGLKVDLVLHEAGLSTRSFYRHFSTKNALMVHLLESEIGRAADHLRAHVAGRSDPTDQVIAWLDAFVALGVRRSTAGRAGLFIATWGALDREFPEAVRRMRAELVGSMAEVLDRGRQQGVFRCDDPMADADHIFSLAVGQLIEVHDEPPHERRPDLVATHRFVLRALDCWPDDS